MEGENEFVKRRIYLTLERGRDIALRNLLRKVFIAGGFEEPKTEGGPRVRRTRIPVAEFVAAISLGSKEALDTDEVECLMANMIYKVSWAGTCTRNIRVSRSFERLLINWDNLEPHEGLYSSRARLRGAKQERCLPWNWCIGPKL